MNRFLIFTLSVASIFFSACAMQSVREVRFAKTERAEEAGLLLIEEDAPRLATLMSGREKLNNLVRFGKQVEEEPETVSIPSTAPDIEKAVARTLKEKTGITKVMKTLVKSEKESIADIVKASGLKAGYVLDTKIESWDAKAHPKSRSRYEFFLKTETRLYDIAAQRMIERYECEEAKRYGNASDAPDQFKLMKEDMKLLKNIMRDLTNACAAATLEHIFINEDKTET